MKQRIIQALLPLAFALLRAAWGATANVWIFAIREVEELDADSNSPAAKLEIAIRNLRTHSGLSETVCRRLIQTAHLYVRLVK